MLYVNILVNNIPVADKCLRRESFLQIMIEKGVLDQNVWWNFKRSTPVYPASPFYVFNPHKNFASLSTLNFRSFQIWQGMEVDFMSTISYIFALIVSLLVIRVCYVLYWTGRPFKCSPTISLRTLVVLGSGWFIDNRSISNFSVLIIVPSENVIPSLMPFPNWNWIDTELEVPDLHFVRIGWVFVAGNLIYGQLYC